MTLEKKLKAMEVKERRGNGFKADSESNIKPTKKSIWTEKSKEISNCFSTTKSLIKILN